MSTTLEVPCQACGGAGCRYCNGTGKVAFPNTFGPKEERITPEDTAKFFKKIDDVMGVPSAVNHPPHYTQGEIECIDAIKSATVGLTGLEAFDTGTAIKYLWRWKHKEKPIEDLEKAKWYIDNLIKHLKESK